MLLNPLWQRVLYQNGRETIAGKGFQEITPILKPEI